MNWYVIDDANAYGREAFVCDSEEMEKKFADYSGWFVVCCFEAEEEAINYCEGYNSYDILPVWWVVESGEGWFVTHELPCEYYIQRGLVAVFHTKEEAMEYLRAFEPKDEVWFEDCESEVSEIEPKRPERLNLRRTRRGEKYNITNAR